MTQADNFHYDLISKEFNGKQIEFIHKDGNVWISSSAIARGLGIDRKNLNRLYHNNRELLEQFSTVIKDEDGKRMLRVFDRTGFIGICWRSNSPNALPFQQWALNVIDSVLETGQYIEKRNLHPLEVLKNQNETLGKIIEYQLDQTRKFEVMEKKMLSVDTKLKTFEQRYEDERIITPKTKRIITDTVQNANKDTEYHWGTIYKVIWDHFRIRSITGISEKLGQEIINWMREHPFFKKYLQVKGGN